uniref:Uncharacterized protein n=1 Tax=Bactrocera latifrons TaxID=174628 RepID=A0A0K8VUF7_BACLA
MHNYALITNTNDVNSAASVGASIGCKIKIKISPKTPGAQNGPASAAKFCKNICALKYAACMSNTCASGSEANKVCRSCRAAIKKRLKACSTIWCHIYFSGRPLLAGLLCVPGDLSEI